MSTPFQHPGSMPFPESDPLDPDDDALLDPRSSPSQTYPNFTFYGDDADRRGGLPPLGSVSPSVHSEVVCPRCGSHHIRPLQTGDRLASAAGTLAGAVHGGLNGYRLPRLLFGETVVGAIGSGAGAELGMVAGKRIGVLLGGPFGPVGMTAGRIAGATLGALVGGAAGCSLGSRLGRAVDQTVLKNHRCDDCGHRFRIGSD